MYIPISVKFTTACTIATAWLVICYWLSIPWITDLAAYVTIAPAYFIVCSIALFPGFMYAFLIVAYLVDNRKTAPLLGPYPPISLLIAAYNEENNIESTLNSIANQDYEGKIQILLIDDGSKDNTISVARACNMPQLEIINANHGGKAAALNYGITFALHELVITIDADTFLKTSALREIVDKLYSGPENTVAVAGSIYVRNSRVNWMTKIQEWDYFHAIAVIKRTQSLLQGTLVAQGAFSLYKKSALLEVGGWPETVGEDIVMTWALLNKGYRIDFAENAISFTNVPETYKQFYFQRSRWARGLIEAFRHHPKIVFKRRLSTFFIFWNLCFIVQDNVFFFVFIPGAIAAFFGYFFIAGPMTLAVLPIGLLNNILFFKGQRRLFTAEGLRVRKNVAGFFIYFLFYQIIMTPAVVYGYLSEFAQFKRSWGTK